MVIGIDIRVLGSTSRSGIEEYTENLLAHMLPLDKTIKYKLFYSSFGQSLNTYDWLLLNNVEVHRFKISNKLLFFSSNFLNEPKVDRLMGGVDAFFSPHFFLTALSSSCKRVTTFHDLSFSHFPEFFSWRKNIWHNFEMKPEWQSKFSDTIISVSESTKQDLVSIYGIDPAKIQVIHSGISSDIRRLSDKEIQSFKRENNLPENYIFYLGKLEPRKNIVGLIRAFDIVHRGLEKKVISKPYLVIAGSRGWLDREIFETYKSSPNKKYIIFKDNIPDKLRAGYYSSSSVFVYPSFFEGFGFPPLEAMACGIPVITSFNSSLPEVTGGASITVDPSNIYDIATSISSILADEELKSQIINKGYKRIEGFSWEKTATKTLECLIK